MSIKTTIHRIDANGLTHHVRDTGEINAPVALLLHGFPDSGAIWDRVTQGLVTAGFRVIAPDLRGFGETEMAAAVADYDIVTGAMPDMLAILDRLCVAKSHLVGHDFGAPVAWLLAAQHPDKFSTLTALSVGHVRAYMAAGWAQKWRSLYVVFHQMRALCEWVYRFNNWAALRASWSTCPDLDNVVARLAQPGRLTAGLNWYRANLDLARLANPPAIGAFGEEIVRIPTLGIWSDGDPYLTERQMTGSQAFVEATWRYERLEGVNHWIPSDAPEALTRLLTDFWRKHWR